MKSSKFISDTTMEISISYLLEFLSILKNMEMAEKLAMFRFSFRIVQLLLLPPVCRQNRGKIKINLEVATRIAMYLRKILL